MALDGLQDLLEKSVKKYQVNYKKIVPKIHLVRYADDFIVTAKDKETIEQVILPLVRKFLAERGLTPVSYTHLPAVRSHPKLRT